MAGCGWFIDDIWLTSRIRDEWHCVDTYRNVNFACGIRRRSS